jgi:hypothetical protein
MSNFALFSARLSDTLSDNSWIESCKIPEIKIIHVKNIVNEDKLFRN